jgi:hypothetical protein
VRKEKDDAGCWMLDTGCWILDKKLVFNPGTISVISEDKLVTNYIKI